MKRFALITVLFLIQVGAASAQFTADFQTNTISGLTSNWIGQPFYIVGSNTAFDVLQILNAGILSNSSSVIGYALDGTNNSAIVSGASSQWTNRFECYVGNNGASSRLIITNSGTVRDVNGYIGNFSGASNGLVFVAGNGAWRNQSNLIVGVRESFNQLLVSNAGIVSAQVSLIGSNSQRNTGWVTGAGATWSNAISLVVGYVAANNQLVVSNAGLAWNAFGYVGSGTLSSNNVATVTGTGSTWRNTNSLYVGYFGSGNELAILTGGTANAQSGYLGVEATGSNNVALIAGSGAAWSNAVNLYVGFAGIDNQLIVTNAGKARNQAGTIGYTNSAVGNLAFIEGAGSVWSNTVYLYVGYVGSGNQLLVSNGATVFSGTGYIGSDRLSSNNVATVVGPGALWTHTNNLHVGFFGSGNALVVGAGGTVRNNETRIGFDPVSSNNVAWVTGSGALLSNANTIVGYGGYGNQLIISNGAKVFDQVGSVGYTNQSTANLAIVTGSGSVWSNTSALYVSYKSPGNQLLIADAGTVVDPDGHIGTYVSSSNNLATVTGNGSRWNNAGYLYVGELASSNVLLVADGGDVNVGLDTRIGWDKFSSNNLVTVTGIGALLSNTVNTLVGYAGPLNQLVVSNNAMVFDQAGIVGYTNTAVRNQALVASGGVWSNTVNFQVGYKASFNELIVSNAGKVYSPNSFIGTFNVASSNRATVTGPGARWISTNGLYVGQDGRSNALVVANGGGVWDVNGYIGYNATALTNSALVTGAGASWTNTTLFYIGTFASGNALTVSNGGKVYTAGDTILGYDATSDRNSVRVTGTNSTWVNNRLYVGLSGASNSVTIANRGQGSILDGYNSTLYIGYNPVSISNTVSITDTGSYWLVANLYLGYASRSNSLTVANGGSLESLQGYVGNTTGSNNFALVTGPGSIWKNNQYLYVGYVGSRNSLVVSNGGVALSSLGSYVGYNAGVSNSVLITDLASTCSNIYNFYVGYSSRGNSIVISNGATAFGGYNGSALGYADSAGNNGSNNFGTIIGVNSVWNNDGSFSVGDAAHSNRLTVAQAGKLASSSTIFVGARGGTNNLLRLTNGLVQASAVNVGTGNYLTGAGTVTGSLLNSGTVAANINGATLTFNSFVKNIGTLRANDGGIIEFYAPVLNFGTTNFTGGTAIFHAGIFTATGTTNSWVFAGNGTWETAARWSRGVVPSPADSLVLITNATTKTVTATNSADNFNIVLAGPINTTNTLCVADTPAPFTAISLTVGSNAVLAVSNATVQVGTFGTGDFIVDGALQVDAGGLVDSTGVSTNRVGTVTLNGGTWTNNLVLTPVGAQWNITGGGQIATAGTVTMETNCVVNISGAGSRFNVESQLIAGNFGGNNHLTIADGGTLRTVGAAYFGGAPESSNNTLTVTGSGSVWTNLSSLQCGSSGANNHLVITNGGKVINNGFVTVIGAYAGGGNSLILTGTNTVWHEYGSVVFYIGQGAGTNRLVVANGGSLNVASGATCALGGSSPGNVATITDSGTGWNAGNSLLVGGGNNNQLIVSNGATVSTFTGYIGSGAAGSNNLVTVTGTNSLWRNTGTLYVGYQANSNRLEIAGGTVTANGCIIGLDGTNNLIRVTSGALFVTNAFGNPALVVSGSGTGSLFVTGGAVTADKLVATNGARSVVILNAGAISAKASFLTNAQTFAVGNGTNVATYRLLGGIHNFNSGLLIRSNAMLSGCGTVNATVVVDPGGTVVADCTPLVFAGIVTNNGTLRAVAGSVLEFYGTVVNNGTLDLISGTTNFHGTLINNGTILNAEDVRITEVSQSGNDINVKAQTYTGHNFQLQQRDSLSGGSWVDVPGIQAGTDSILTFPEFGGATNSPSRFYRIRCTP